MRLAQQVAIVTGAGSGIGKAIAERFAAEGAHVVIAEVNEAGAEAVACAIAARGQQTSVRLCDVSDEDEVAGMVRSVLDERGRVDILVNNAICSVEMVHANSWRVIEVAVGGAWNCSRAVLPAMMERRSGAIVNVSSINALMGFGPEHLYTAAKGAMVSLTRSLAAEYGRHGIRVNCLCPGSTDTEHWEPIKAANPAVLENISKLYPLGRIGQPHEVASAALFLASEEASFVSGGGAGG